MRNIVCSWFWWWQFLVTWDSLALKERHQVVLGQLPLACMDLNWQIFLLNYRGINSDILLMSCNRTLPLVDVVGLVFPIASRVSSLISSLLNSRLSRVFSSSLIRENNRSWGVNHFTICDMLLLSTINVSSLVLGPLNVPSWLVCTLATLKSCLILGCWNCPSLYLLIPLVGVIVLIAGFLLNLSWTLNCGWINYLKLCIRILPLLLGVCWLVQLHLIIRIKLFNCHRLVFNSRGIQRSLFLALLLGGFSPRVLYSSSFTAWETWRLALDLRLGLDTSLWGWNLSFYQSRWWWLLFQDLFWVSVWSVGGLSRLLQAPLLVLQPFCLHPSKCL